MNSEVRSNKYFESVTPKPKLSSYDSSTNEKDNSDDYEDRYNKAPRYSDAKTDDKTDYKNDDKNDDKTDDKNDDKNDDKHDDKIDDKHDDKANDDKPISYSKEYTPSKKYTFGYRYYGQNRHPDDYGNKKGDTMKLIDSSKENESGDKSPNDESTRSNEQSNQEDESHSSDKENHSDGHSDSNEPDDSTNETIVSSPRESSNSSRSNASEEHGNSNEDYRVDEEFSGSRRYARSVTNSDYFRSIDRKSLDSYVKPRRQSVRRQESYENDFEDNEEDLIDELNRSKTFRKYFYGLNRRKSAIQMPPKSSQDVKRIRLQPNKSVQKPKHRIVSFDVPPANYEKRNFETAASSMNHGLVREHHLSDFKRRTYLRSLKDDYDDEFDYKSSRPRLERRKCSNAGRHKHLHKIYSRDDHYDDLIKNPMYKNYQYL